MCDKENSITLKGKPQRVTLEETKRFSITDPFLRNANIYPEICLLDRVIGLIEKLLESNFTDSCTIYDSSFGGYMASQLAGGIHPVFKSGVREYCSQPAKVSVLPTLYSVDDPDPDVCKNVQSNIQTMTEGAFEKNLIPIKIHTSLTIENPSVNGLLVATSNKHTEPHLLFNLLESCFSNSPKVIITRQQLVEGAVPDVSHVSDVWNNRIRRTEGTEQKEFYYTQYTLSEYKKVTSENMDGSEISMEYVAELSSRYIILVKTDYIAEFESLFGSRLVGRELFTDNLLNIVIMVKNAGDTWEKVIKDNLPFADRFTIVDTGSTDGTVETACKVLGESGIPWHVHTNVPFTDFAATRNIALDLAGTSCAFNIMLDDTYTLNGNLRNLLFQIRADNIAESISLFISNSIISYASNRITRPQINSLRYILPVHEIITPNKSVIIPREIAWISEFFTPFMEKRTSDRKLFDLRLLKQQLKKDPTSSRTVYYIADTYLCMSEYKKAVKYYRLRSRMLGLEQFEDERYDAMYKATSISYTYCEDTLSNTLNSLLEIHASCPHRVDALYNIIALLQLKAKCLTLSGKFDDPELEEAYKKNPTLQLARCNGYRDLALMYSQKAMSLPRDGTQLLGKRENIYDVALPEEALTAAQYGFDGKLMISAAKRIQEFILNTKKEMTPEVKSYAVIKTQESIAAGELLIRAKKDAKKPGSKEKLNLLEGAVSRISRDTNNFNNGLVLFVAPDGWESWDGETLQTTGLGGSEACIVNYAETMFSQFQIGVIVFCKRDGGTMREKAKPVPPVSIYRGVTYISTDLLPLFLSTQGPLDTLDILVASCFVSRRTSYMPLVCMNRRVLKANFMMHDVCLQGLPFFIYDKVTSVMCLSQWHGEQIESVTGNLLQGKIKMFLHGIETSDYSGAESLDDFFEKESKSDDGDQPLPLRFIYPSFPNRGLLYLLRLFPRIVAEIPQAHLDVFVRFDLDYLQNGCFQEMQEIKTLLEKQKQNVTNHGWVNPESLRHFWKAAHIWVYPCVFEETFCKVALESAISKTLAIAPPLAALQTSIGERGVLIQGDPKTREWADKAVAAVLSLFKSKGRKIIDKEIAVKELLRSNYEWASLLTNRNVTEALISTIINA
jgi:glycosyltransferase involved in cell wall biosynthesis